jgi:arylsulfatase A-like enzyme
MLAAVCVGLAWSAAAESAAFPGADSPPSIVVLLSDDAGWADPGWTIPSRAPGHDIRTPNLDALAAQSLVLDACYVTASVCSPSRAGLLTGRHQQRFGHEFNLPGTASRADGGLPLGERTIADRLRAAGYATGLVGKWHLGLDDRFLPTRRGFDEFRGLRSGSRSYFGDEKLSGGDRAWERLDTDESLELPESEIDYVTDLVAEEAVDFIARHANEPSFLVASFTAPHTPMHALDADLDAVGDGVRPPKRRTYAAMWLALDRACGRIVDAVEASGRDTIIVFLNDNGGATNNASDNGPFRGMKGSQFEGGLRVPAIWARRGDRTGRFESPVSVLDLVATLARAGGADTDGLDGVDLAPWFDADGTPPTSRPRTTFHWRRGPVATVRQGDLKLICVDGRPSMLFDLATDPGEAVDLSAERPDVAMVMLAELARWERGMVTPRWTTGAVWQRHLLQKHSMDVVGREAERALP